MKQPQMIFINLPVANLNKSISFYKEIGFTQNQQFSDETAACMVLSESIHVMLLTHPKWKTFTTLAIPDAQKSAQMLLALSRESKESVDLMVDGGHRAGGKADPNPKQDLGFMYSRSLSDPDGHIWESFWMDMSAVPS